MAEHEYGHEYGHEQLHANGIGNGQHAESKPLSFKVLSKEDIEKENAKKYLDESLSEISNMSENMPLADIQKLQMILSAVYRANDSGSEEFTGGSSNLLDNLANIIHLNSSSSKSSKDIKELSGKINLNISNTLNKWK